MQETIENNIVDVAQDNDEINTKKLKQLSAKAYMEYATAQVELLFEQCVKYKEKFDLAKTSTAKDMYGKKLKRYTKMVEQYMTFFSNVQTLNEEEEKQSVKKEEKPVKAKKTKRKSIKPTGEAE